MDWAGLKQRFRLAESLDAIGNIGIKIWSLLCILSGAVGTVLANGWQWATAQGWGFAAIVGIFTALAFIYALIGIAFLIQRLRGTPVTPVPPAAIPAEPRGTVEESGQIGAGEAVSAVLALREEIGGRIAQIEGGVARAAHVAEVCRSFLLDMRRVDAERNIAERLSEIIPVLPEIPDDSAFDRCNTAGEREDMISNIENRLHDILLFPMSIDDMPEYDRQICQKIIDNINEQTSYAREKMRETDQLSSSCHDQQKAHFVFLKSRIEAFHRTIGGAKNRCANASPNWRILEQ